MTTSALVSDKALRVAPDAAALQDRIRARKRELGTRVVVLTHHYQRKEVVDIGDYRGDSFNLAKYASEQKDAEFIVFCGVHFMAESADILARPEQKVYLPDINAGCPMADMGAVDIVENAWERIHAALGPGAKVIPVTYMNSAADLKAFCGRHGGSVCTSSNAAAVFEWAFAQNARIFFFPDEHLGRNTGNKLGLPRESMKVWDRLREDGGLTPEQIRGSRVLLWKGYCHVHTHYTLPHIAEAKAKYPDCVVIVHPECPEEIVAAADLCGSTTFIDRWVAKAPAGSVIFIGTEMMMTHRLAQEHPDKKILTLSRSLCPNMYKTDLRDVAECMDHLGSDRNVVRVPGDIKKDARKALERMLALPGA